MGPPDRRNDTYRESNALDGSVASTLVEAGPMRLTRTLPQFMRERTLVGDPGTARVCVVLVGTHEVLSLGSSARPPLRPIDPIRGMRRPRTSRHQLVDEPVFPQKHRAR